jgi:hypothetical protein
MSPRRHNWRSDLQCRYSLSSIHCSISEASIMRRFGK